MADEGKGKSTWDYLKDTYNFFVPKKKTIDADRKMSKKEKEELDKGMEDVFNQRGKEKN
jgi:hypothetical protein